MGPPHLQWLNCESPKSLRPGLSDVVDILRLGLFAEQCLEISTSSHDPPNQYVVAFNYRAHVLDQYKLYVKMADAISNRRNATNAFFSASTPLGSPSSELFAPAKPFIPHGTLQSDVRE
jgi:hypothetical protein